MSLRKRLSAYVVASVAKKFTAVSRGLNDTVGSVKTTYAQIVTQAQAVSANLTTVQGLASTVSTDTQQVATNTATVSSALATVQQLQAQMAQELATFQRVWYGAQATDPEKAPDGSAIPVGAEYYNTTRNILRVQTGEVTTDEPYGWADADANYEAATAAAQLILTTVQGLAAQAQQSASDAATSDNDAKNQAALALQYLNALKAYNLVMPSSATANYVITINGDGTAYQARSPSDTMSLLNAASLTSPNFNGTPTTPTAGQDTATTQLASCAFVLNQASSSVPNMSSTGGGSIGTSLRYARADHVHPWNTAAISGVAWMDGDTGDMQIFGFHWSGNSGGMNRPVVAYGPSTDDLSFTSIALYSDITAEQTARQNADAQLMPMSVTSGASIIYGSSGAWDLAFQTDGNLVVYNGSTALFSVGGASGSVECHIPLYILDATLSNSPVSYGQYNTGLSAETTRATNAEANLVSGVTGVITSTGDRAGRGMHLNGGTQRPSFIWDGGACDLVPYNIYNMKRASYLNSGSVTVPNQCSLMIAILVGGGGAGAGCQTSTDASQNRGFGGGGGSGAYIELEYSVSPGQTISFTVGEGATSTTDIGSDAADGAPTSVSCDGTVLATANGGASAKWVATDDGYHSCAGGNGGAPIAGSSSSLIWANGSYGGDGQTDLESNRGTGYGAPGPWGGGGRAGNDGGTTAWGFGAGGGGAYDYGTGGVFGRGGSGYQGIVILQFK